MDRALWLLLRLRLLSGFRRIKRSLITVKGALFAALALLLVLPWLLMMVLVRQPALDSDEAVQMMVRFGPFALLAYCLLSLSFTSGESILAFTPAETNWLFPGPFSRRQLLGYKLTVNSLGILVTAFFLTLFVRLPRASFLAGYLGFVLTLEFVQLFATALGLLANTIGVRAYSRWRKLMVAAIVALALALFLRFGGELLTLPPLELLQRVEQTRALQWVLEPLRCFLRVFVARQFWPDLLQWAALSLLVDLLLVGVIFTLDAQYLEGSLAASERLYAKLQQLRSGGAAAMGLRSSGKPRFGLPTLPWWGGAGPILWRQLTTALRSRGPVLLLFILATSAAGPIIASRYAPNEGVVFSFVVAGLVGMMTMFLTALVAFDFRGDLDRMDVLKTLPLAPVSLVIGQLLAPTLVVGALQWLAVIVLGAVGRRFDLAHVAIMALALPFNFFLFGMENALFLLFPTRVMAATPGDFQALGRNLLLWFLKMIGIGAALTTCGVVGFAAYFLSGRSLPAALFAAWPVLAVFAVTTVPLAALAFRRFDVARDTPP